MYFKGLQYLLLVFVLGWWEYDVQGQRLAAQKCLKYQNIVVSRQTLIRLIIGPQPFEFDVFNCTNVVQLIIGGEQAKTGEFPHHVLLGFQKEAGKKWEYDFKCGGTLISNQHVLTAAHCFSYGDPVIVRLGENDTKTESGQEYDSDIGSIRLHPNYRSSRSYHDIALIKLKHQITFSKHIRPACLWETEERNTTRYIATGFGHNETLGTELSTVMMKVQLEEVSVSDCEGRVNGNRKFNQGIKPGQFCVGSSIEGRDTCQGDSGGPLQVVTNALACTYAVVGITSIGSFCGIGNSAAVYTKVSHYIGWIEDNVWGANAM